MKIIVLFFSTRGLILPRHGLAREYLSDKTMRETTGGMRCFHVRLAVIKCCENSAFCDTLIAGKCSETSAQDRLNIRIKSPQCQL